MPVIIELFLESILPRRRLLREIREAWGKPGAKDGWLADRYFCLAKTDDELSQIDERTWNDLEFPLIFGSLDTTVTPLGSQCLFRMLRTYAGDPEETESLHRSVQTLRRDKKLRERIQLTLASLQLNSAAMVIDDLLDPQHEGLKHPLLMISWSAVCLAVLAAMATSVISWMFLIPILLINSLVIARTESRQEDLSGSLRAMQRMLAVANKLTRNYEGQPISQLADLLTNTAGRKRAERAFRFFGVTERLDRQLFGLGTWLHFLFLAKWLTYLFTVDRVPAVHPELRKVYELLGSLDASIAVASFLQCTDTWCRPTIGPARTVRIDGGYHPLLERPVPNSLSLSERSALITGSNMAGKTTFVKMMAINVILGRTLGICLAEKATIPASPVMVSIRNQESVQSGKSRYFAEIEAILSFLRAGERSPLIVIDEPFSGTNTSERIAAGKSVLGALSEHSLVLATTHDVELQDLLREQFDMYHFTENPDLDDFFDYHLRTGPCIEGNALRLLARLGFPPDIINEANTFVDERRKVTREKSTDYQADPGL